MATDALICLAVCLMVRGGAIHEREMEQTNKSYRDINWPISHTS
jgi:hypothetical protein